MIYLQAPHIVRERSARAFQTRLTLTFVRKSRNELFREYLYQTIPCLAGCEFSQLIGHLTSNYLTKFVKRIALHSPIANPPKSSANDVLAHFPNLDIVDIQPDNYFRPRVNQRCIVLMRAHFDDWPAFWTLALLPHLRHLRCTVHNRCPVDSRSNWADCEP